MASPPAPASSERCGPQADERSQGESRGGAHGEGGSFAEGVERT